uniref:Uncharacterized protein n=1 Tax=Sphaerodactylus townsendi TaxID=933632 RepID=A0ACB8EEG8_9SAUR
MHIEQKGSRLKTAAQMQKPGTAQALWWKKPDRFWTQTQETFRLSFLLAEGFFCTELACLTLFYCSLLKPPKCCSVETGTSEMAGEANQRSETEFPFCLWNIWPGSNLAPKQRMEHVHLPFLSMGQLQDFPAKYDPDGVRCIASPAAALTGVWNAHLCQSPA